jgi:hypothetical protein
MCAVVTRLISPSRTFLQKKTIEKVWLTTGPENMTTKAFKMFMEGETMN